MGLEFKIDTRAFLASLDSLQNRFIQRASDALNEEHQSILRDAKANCPVDTGALRDSGEVFEPVAQHGEIVSTGAFGNDAETGKYAIPVHESTWIPHRIGESKWYQHALERGADGLAERVMRKALK